MTMNKYIVIIATFSIFGAEKELSKPIIHPREVIIYPPVTPAEFLERQRILRELMENPHGAKITVKNTLPKDKDK